MRRFAPAAPALGAARATLHDVLRGKNVARLGNESQPLEPPRSFQKGSLEARLAVLRLTSYPWILALAAPRSRPAPSDTERPRSTPSVRVARVSSGLVPFRPTPTGPGSPPRSRASGRRCCEQFSQCKGRIIVTSFASNIHRVQQVIDAAVALDRKVALVGRSMRKNFNIASNLGMAKAPAGHLHPAAGDRGLPRPEGRRDLDRQPGRAALGAAADGQQRPPRRASCTPATRWSSRRRRCPATSAR